MGQKVPITEEQKKLSYAKYFYIDVAPFPQESLDILSKGPINPSKALSIHDRNRLFESGYLDTEIGYCVMEDGTAFVANKTTMPEVTVEMFDWWFAWHGLGELRYSLWDNEDHYSARSLNLAQGKCPQLSLKEKYWGTTHLIVEDIGGGPGELYATFRDPKEMGFDAEKIGTPACGTIVTSNSGPTDGSLAITMCHFVREIEKGIELRTRFWLGYHIISGKAVKILPNNVSIPLEAVKGLIYHNVKEFNNLGKLLPEIYPEQKDNWK